MKNPAYWERSDLHRNMQHALDLELWTIPLYLTSLYSIKDLTKIKHQDFPEAAKLLFSVVIQEMLHVEIVCNLSNALGYTPKFKCPEYDVSKGIPFIHPPYDSLPDVLRGYQVKPQALNKESLKLFCAIELPHPKKAIVWENEGEYNSIAELYEAIKTGVASLWDGCYIGERKNTKQKNSFNEYHNQHGKKHGFSIIINSVETALQAIEAIVEQGEGADAKHVPVDFRPHVTREGKEFDTAWYKSNLSHYHKFRILLHSHHKLPPVYKEEINKKAETANSNMKNAFLNFWNTMEINFNQEGDEMPETFWKEMFALGNSLADVWLSGMCPDLNFDISSARSY
ncbi:MAG: ferritin-like protein [Chitinophagales bacterium]